MSPKLKYHRQLVKQQLLKLWGNKFLSLPCIIRILYHLRQEHKLSSITQPLQEIWPWEDKWGGIAAAETMNALSSTDPEGTWTEGETFVMVVSRLAWKVFLAKNRKKNISHRLHVETATSCILWAKKNWNQKLRKTTLCHWFLPYLERKTSFCRVNEWRINWQLFCIRLNNMTFLKPCSSKTLF